MNTAAPASLAVPTVIGTPFEGGFYTGRIRIDAHEYAEITAPKAEGERLEVRWNASYERVPGAQSYGDGLANTRAMAEAGSEIARWALAARIGGFDDWHLPALDQLELRYRYLKPGTRRNDCWLRSGINLSAETPTWPYTPEDPAQTGLELFREGAAEAFAPEWYWTSTQSAAFADYAWAQVFGYGGQDDYRKTHEFAVRLVRRSLIR